MDAKGFDGHNNLDFIKKEFKKKKNFFYNNWYNNRKKLIVNLLTIRKIYQTCAHFNIFENIVAILISSS